MAISVTNIGVGSNSAGATTTITAVTVPAGACIIVGVEEASSQTTAGTVTDGSNTYSQASATLLHPNATQANGFGMLYYSNTVLALSGGTITYTKKTSAVRAVTTAFYATGLATGDPRDTGVFNHAAGSSTTPSVTSNAASVAGDLFVALLCTSNNPTFTQDTTHGWATPPTASDAAGASVMGGNQVNAGTSAITFSPTITSGAWDAAIYGFLALAVAQNPFAKTDWPNPIITPPRQDFSRFQFLGLPTSNPMPQTAQTDWPVVRALPRLAQDHIRTPQLSVASAPAAQTDWPVPTTRPAPRPDLQASRFLGFPTANPQVAQLDWPLPIPPWRANVGAAAGAFIGLPATNPAPQIAQYDWPVPRGAKPVVADYVRGSPQALRIDVSPFVQTDWPVVRRVPALLQDDLAGQFAGLPSTNPMPAIAQLDWPVVRAIPRLPQDFTTWKQLTATSPITPMDWPVTRTTPRPIQDWTRSQYLGLPTANVQPFSTPERPNPRAAPRVVPDFILQSPQALRLDVKPFAQADWPVPRPAARFHFDHAPPRLLGLQALTKPFSQTDWPTFRALARPPQDFLRGRFLGLPSGASLIVSPGPGNVVLAGLVPALTQAVSFAPGASAMTLAGASTRITGWFGAGAASSGWGVVPAPDSADDWTKFI